MSDPNTSPVSLAAGSYDYDALKAGLNKAARGSEKNYDEAVAKTLDEASERVHANQDPRDIPGYKFVDVENKDLGVTERVQVFDAKLAEEQDSGTDAISEADSLNRQAENRSNGLAATSPKE